jgi:cytochrome P450
MRSDEEAHARYRKTPVHPFSEKSMGEQGLMSESHVDQLVRKLREADAGTTSNLVE